MASIGREGNRLRILFVAPDGKRKTVRLGKTTKRAAEAIKMRIEHLAAAAISPCAWDAQTAASVQSLDDVLYDRLYRAGLVPPREHGQTLGG